MLFWTSGLLVAGTAPRVQPLCCPFGVPRHLPHCSCFTRQLVTPYCFSFHRETAALCLVCTTMIHLHPQSLYFVIEHSVMSIRLTLFYVGGYLCDWCGKSFRLQYYLSQHERSQHLGVQYSCNICQRSFSRKKTSSPQNHVCRAPSVKKRKAPGPSIAVCVHKVRQLVPHCSLVLFQSPAYSCATTSTTNAWKSLRKTS